MLYNDVQCDFVRCPFEESHVIRRYKLPYHLHKCKKNHPGMNMATCSYNFSHLVPKVNIVQHLESCPSKCWIESGRYNNSDPGNEVCEKKFCEPDFSDRERNSREKYFISETFTSRRSKYENVKKEEKESIESVQDNLTEESFHDMRLSPLPLPKSASKAFKATLINGSI